MTFQILDATKTAEAILELIDNSEEVKIAAYCISKSALSYYEEALTSFLKNGGKLSILFGLRTLPDVLSEIEKFEANSKQKIRTGLIISPTFHPKIYLFRMRAGKTVAIVGSSNFTESAFTENIEMNIKIQNAQNIDKQYEFYFLSEDIINDRKEIAKELKAMEKINRRFDAKMQKKQQICRSKKSVKRIYEKIKPEDYEKIEDTKLRKKLQEIQDKYEEEIRNNTAFEENTRRGKIAWLRARLNFAIETIKKHSNKLNDKEKLYFFDAVGKYTLMDEEHSEFLDAPYFKELRHFIIRKKMDSDVKEAHWSKEHALFGVLKRTLSDRF
ncbi:MAG: phospholipase D-like domain-containing protein [Candidatus Bathyarchaeota archaeon]|nr:phospholipase D-like domain-containing protein [Candidatus Bathyarchaeota archaeon]